MCRVMVTYRCNKCGELVFRTAEAAHPGKCVRRMDGKPCGGQLQKQGEIKDEKVRYAR